MVSDTSTTSDSFSERGIHADTRNVIGFGKVVDDSDLPAIQTEH